MCKGSMWKRRIFTEEIGSEKKSTLFMTHDHIALSVSAANI